ncbi:MAG TPA: PD-(D/E)XK nuclease family protein [Thermoplasmata archaeon]|nr:PD-(D/E)XK nuclease family protein [Thermoplasmata archaeon]
MAAAPALSYSSYRTYLECPLRWKYLYVERRPETPRGYFTFGRVVHSVLEELVRPFVVPAARRTEGGESQRTLDDWRTGPATDGAPPHRLSPEELLALYDRSWSSEGYTSPEEEARYRSLGRELLLKYHDRLERDPPKPVAVEQHLEAKWDGIPIHGYIDRIDRTSTGGLEVMDYKTSRELSHEDARESDQLSLYQVLVESNYAEPVERLTLYHLRTLTPLRTRARDRSSLDPLHVRLGSVADGIREQAFEPTPGRQCARCDFRTICPEFREVPAGDGERLTALVDRFEALRADERRLELELARTADELHRAAEALGVHRVPGSRSVAIRRREEAWQFSLDSIRPLLESSGMATRLGQESPDEVKRLLRDPEVPAELRRKVSETGSRRVRWYWELEAGDGGAGTPRSAQRL